MFKWKKTRKEMQNEINRLNCELDKAREKIEELQANISNDDGLCHTLQCSVCKHFRKDEVTYHGRNYGICELAYHPCKHFT